MEKALKEDMIADFSDIDEIDFDELKEMHDAIESVIQDQAEEEGDVEIGRDVSIADEITFGGIIYSHSDAVDMRGDVTVTNTLFVDEIRDRTREGIEIESDTTMDFDLTIAGGELYGEPNLTINPNQSDSGVLTLGVQYENDEIEWPD